MKTLLTILLFATIAQASPVQFNVTLKPTGYGAAGNYHAFFQGNGHDWSVRITPGKNVNAGLTLIDFCLEMKDGSLMSLTPTIAARGYVGTDRQSWERQPSAKDYWKTEWVTTDPSKSVYGHAFFGSFSMMEDASLATRITMMGDAGYTRSTMKGQWYGDSADVPEVPTALLLVIGISAILTHRKFATSCGCIGPHTRA